MKDRWAADSPKFTVVKKDKHKYQAYLDRKSKKRVKDLPVEEQRARYFLLTGHDPTDAELEMALDLNLL